MACTTPAHVDEWTNEFTDQLFRECVEFGVSSMFVSICSTEIYESLGLELVRTEEDLEIIRNYNLIQPGRLWLLFT
jgi:hypothetical protein